MNHSIASPYIVFFFFFNDTATTEIYTLSLHDALPISQGPKPWRKRESRRRRGQSRRSSGCSVWWTCAHRRRDRKSTRLNSSHTVISYAVFCLKKKKKDKIETYTRYTYGNSTIWNYSST